MKYHISDQSLLDYLSGELNKFESDEVTAHIVECDQCMDRINGFVYLKKHYNEIKNTVSLHEILCLQGEISGSENKEIGSDMPVKTMSFAKKLKMKWWIPLSSAVMVATVILVILLGQLGMMSRYEYWKMTGVISNMSNLNEVVEKKELTQMISRLAGVKDASISLPESELTIKDGAAAIKNYFKLDIREYSEMLGEMNPGSKLTYKAAIDLIDNFAGEIYSELNVKDGIKSNIVVNKPGTVMKNLNIPGNLYVMQGVADGEVILENVNILGKTYILGGGMSSIVLKDSKAPDLLVSKGDGKIRIYAEGMTEIEKTTLDAGAKLQNDNSTDSFKNISISEELPIGSELIFMGSFGKIGINSTGLQVKLEEGMINELTAGEKAVKTVIEVARAGIVEKLNANATLLVKGDGLVKEVNINTVGVKLEIRTEKVNKSESVSILEPDRLFDDEGKPLNGLNKDLGKLEALFFERYSDKINAARKDGKAVVVEGFVFLPDQRLSDIISKTTGMRYFYSGNNIGGFGSAGRIKELAEITTFKNEVDIDGQLVQGVWSDTIKTIEGIEYLKNLKELNLLLFPPIDAKPFAQLKNLKKFSVRLTPGNGADLSPVSEINSLESLEIESYHATKDKIEYLSLFRNLKRLKLVGFGSLKDLSSLRGMKSLEELDLRFVSAKNPAGVDALKQLTSLKKIVVQEMTGWVPFTYYAPNITDLELRFNEDVDYFDIMAKMPNLRRVTFSNNDLFGRGNWEKLLGMKNLTTLNVAGGNWLTNAEIQKIISDYLALPSNQRNEAAFRQLENKIIEDKKQKIKNALPNCQIIYGQREKLELPIDR